MKNISTKKISLFYLSVLFWQFIIIPVKTFALSYAPLEGGLFTGVGGKPIGAVTPANAGQQFGDFLGQAFSLGLAIAAALAVVMIVWGGVEVMLSESPFGKTNGKEKIKNAIYGLLLALFSWLILNIINPDLLKFVLKL